jgi:microtubule-associated serine/threonine kinase
VFLQANNPFVVRFYYSFSSPEKLFLVMEYCPGGDLSSVLQHLGRFDEHVARQYIAETVLALEYCHSKVCHCNLGVRVFL